MAQATGSTQDLINVGPDEAAKLARPLTAHESRLVADAVAKHGSHSAALGVQDPRLAAEVDALFRR